MATLYPKRGMYYIEFTVKGKRITKCLKLKATERNKTKALQIKKEIEVEFESNNDISKFTPGNMITVDSIKELTLNDAINKFKDERFGINTSKSHKKNFNIAMSYLKQVIPIQSKVLEVTSTDIAKVIRILESQVSNATLHTYIRYLKMLFNYLVDEDYLIKSPVKKKLMPKREKKNVVTFDDLTLKRIIDEALSRDQKFCNILQMLLLTGARPNDLLNFRVEDFNFNSNILNIRISKTNREIKFPIYDELLNFIEKNMKEEFSGNKTDLIFKPFTVIAISKRFIRIKKKLGLTESFVYTLKTFRKTFATRMAKRGVPIHEVAYMLGHESIHTTKKYYTEVRVDNLREKINSINRSK